MTSMASGTDRKLDGAARLDVFWLLACTVALAFCDSGGAMLIALYVESLALLAPGAWSIVNNADASPRARQSARSFLKASLRMLGIFLGVSVGYALGIQRPLFW